jgi:hypothetical protein
MQRPKKPTLAQLKKRPSLWMNERGEPRILYCDFSIDVYNNSFSEWISLFELPYWRIQTKHSWSFEGWL